MSVPGRSVAEYALNRAGGPGCTRPLGEAINYALGQWDALALFLTDPHLPIDNYASERALRVAELGRKNFPFVGTNKAG